MDDALREILRERTWVSLGQVTTPEAPASPATGMSAGARMALVQLAGVDTPPVQCRVLHLGQGLGRGVFTPILSGDEVLVLFPAGDPNRAVCIGGFGNGVAVNPVANDLLHFLLQHPGGVELRSVDGLPAHGIVMGTLLTDLATYVVQLEALLDALIVAGVGPLAPIATAINAWAAAIGKTAGLPSPFSVQLTASGAGDPATGQGAAPYASPLNRVTP